MKLPARRTMLRTMVCAALALAAFVSHLNAVTGTVVDPDGAPVSGARVCYMSGGAEIICVQTDSTGFYELPDSSQERIRIVAQGYVPELLAAIDQEKPIALKRSATLLARLEDAATGERLAEGKLQIVLPSGRKRGPFPSNRAGVRVRMLSPGTVTVVGEAEGYRRSESRSVKLEAGKETEVILRLAPLEPEKSQEDSSEPTSPEK